MYRDYLEQSQIFVGIYWQRYGWVGPGMEIFAVWSETGWYRPGGGAPRARAEWHADRHPPCLWHGASEVHRAGQVVFAEPASASADEGVLHADEALAHVAARGLFVSERQIEFDFRVYGSSGDELRDFLAEADAHSNQDCEEACDAYESELSARGWTASWLAKQARWKSPTTNGRGLLG
jgi:hypothetical protein